MKRNLMLSAGNATRLAVLEEIKRSARGLSVREISATLGMSYMGVKSHCGALAASGHVTTWRKPSSPNSKGRPRLLYKLADSGEKFFAESEDRLALGLLSEAAGLFGATAPQKLLLMYFRSLEAHYREQISSKELIVRARALARLRDKEGRMAELHESHDSWELRESHNPMSSLIQSYPGIRAMEEHLIGEVLGTAVRRREEGRQIIFAPEKISALPEGQFQ